MHGLNHFDSAGNARMVDVGDKAITRRTATAGAIVRMKRSTANIIASGESKKGDVLGTARIAGIMGSKATANLIPMCHPIPIDSVDIEFEIRDSDGESAELVVTSVVSSTGRTGVEMEALTCAATTALTVYDMCKSVDREMAIREIHLIEKTGGKSGHFKRNEPEAPANGEDNA